VSTITLTPCPGCKRMLKPGETAVALRAGACGRCGGMLALSAQCQAAGCGAVVSEGVAETTRVHFGQALCLTHMPLPDELRRIGGRP